MVNLDGKIIKEGKIGGIFNLTTFVFFALFMVMTLTACNNQIVTGDIIGTWETATGMNEETGEEFFVFSLTFNADGSGYGHLFPTLDTGYFTWVITGGNNIQMESVLPVSITLYDVSVENKVLSFNNINGETHPTFTWIFNRQ